MADTRDRVRRSVLVGVQILRDVGAGVRDAAKELADPRIALQRTREQELELARQQGRWLSDAERDNLEQAAQGRLQRRRTLLVLLVISALLPLLWPLVPLWAGLLWWPRTTRRVLWFGLTAAGLLLVAVVVLVIWLLLR